MNVGKRIVFVSFLVLLLSFLFQVVSLVNHEAIKGEVHHQRQRQMISEASYFRSNWGRITANKWVVAYGEVKKRLLEASDLNIIFFAGHPNERVGIMEIEKIWWGMLVFFVIGVWSVFNNKQKYKYGWLSLVFLSLAWAISFKEVEGIAMAGILFIVYITCGLGMYWLFKKLK